MRFLPLMFVLLLPLPVLAAQAEDETLYQVASIESLMQGVYDTGVPCGELLRHGDTGLGTFENLDGEMVVLEGQVYQVRADGSVARMPAEARTPFACVTRFDSDTTLELQGLEDFDQLAGRIAAATAQEPNMIYAVRASGRFSRVRTRSVAGQERPFPGLVAALQDQPEFEFAEVRGELVGFYLPQMLSGLNVPGLHLHFLTESRDAGGHVLELQASELEVHLDATPLFTMLMPGDAAFQNAPLDGRTGEDLEQAER